MASLSASIGLEQRVSVSRGFAAPKTDQRHLSDEDLLGLCAQQSESAMEELVRRYQAPIYRFLLRMMGSQEDAEEAALDVFVKAWQHAGRFQYRAKVATWLYRIAVNIARDAHSRKKSKPVDPWPEEHELDHLAVDSAEDEALQTLSREQDAAKLNRALEKISPSDRLILVLYYLEERSYDEIQEIAGLSYTVLKTRLARARRRLRQSLEAVD